MNASAPAEPKLTPLLVIVAINALASVVATYALLRGYDVCFRSEPNPATIVWSAHIAMFWRLGIGGYIAGLTSIVVFMLARQNLPRAIRITAVVVPVAGALIAIQGALLP